MSRGAYHWQHEPCWYVVRKGCSARWKGDRKQSTVWDVQNLNPTGNRVEERLGHGAQKPVEIMRRPILNHTAKADTVYDPFLGSGTTVIAAESIGRVCFGLEIDPAYCDVIVTRWQNLTGKQATLEGSNATFEHVRDGRRLEAEDAIKEEVLETLSK
jgi:DNA modification methylase